MALLSETEALAALPVTASELAGWKAAGRITVTPDAKRGDLFDEASVKAVLEERRDTEHAAIRGRTLDKLNPSQTPSTWTKAGTIFTGLGLFAAAAAVWLSSQQLSRSTDALYADNEYRVSSDVFAAVERVATSDDPAEWSSINDRVTFAKRMRDSGTITPAAWDAILKRACPGNFDGLKGVTDLKVLCASHAALKR